MPPFSGRRRQVGQGIATHIAQHVSRSQWPDHLTPPREDTMNADPFVCTDTNDNITTSNSSVQIDSITSSDSTLPWSQSHQNSTSNDDGMTSCVEYPSVTTPPSTPPTPSHFHVPTPHRNIEPTFREIMAKMINEMSSVYTPPTSEDTLHYVNEILREFEQCDLQHVRICSGLFCSLGCSNRRKAMICEAVRFYRYFRELESAHERLDGTAFAIKAKTDDLLVRFLVQKCELPRRGTRIYPSYITTQQCP